MELWELLLIDNASDCLLSLEIDINWHNLALHIREDQLGLTPARMRGIKESKADLLIFVDDDNLLNHDYLETALRISKDFPFIGAWGGNIDPLFEKEAPDWIHPYLSYLAVRQVEKNIWSNLTTLNNTVPCGAGLCVLKIVANQYLEHLLRDPLRISLGRKGGQLSSCEDSDLALTACDMGLGTGQFTDLKMKHIIPEFRCTKTYILKLAEGLAFSGTLLEKIRNETIPLLSVNQKIKIYIKQIFMAPSFKKRVFKALIKGRFRAIDFIKTI
jgi:glycosyltransferase involved in cell wall biosynthesis